MEMSARKVDLDKVFPLATVLDGAIISRRGDVTLGWELTLPGSYSLMKEEYDDMLLNFCSAAAVLPPWTMIHRQDVFLYDTYHGTKTGRFLPDAYEAHFEGRRYLTHRQYIYLTMSSRSSGMRPGASSGLFGFKVSTKLPKQEDIYAFESSCFEFIESIVKGGYITARRLTQDELRGTPESAGMIQRYMMFGEDSPVLSDIQLKPDMVKVKDKCMIGFSICEGEDMPASIENVTKVDKLSSTSSELFLSYASPLGMLLDCEHVVNQYILVPQQNYILQELDKKRKKESSGSGTGEKAANLAEAENRSNADEIEDFINAVNRDSAIAVFAHMNVLAWGDEMELLDIRSKVGSALKSMGTKAVQDIYDMPVLYYAGIPGADCEIGRDNLMVMELRSAACMSVNETFERSLPGGNFKICDRTRNVPLTIDLQQVAYDLKLIYNYNAFVLGASGTGKSFFTNFYLRQMYDAGEHIFVIDVGDSYEGLCEVINEESAGMDGHYHSWDVEHPFSFNPFVGYDEWLDPSGNLKQDCNGATFIMSFLQTVWAPVTGWTSDTTPVLRQLVTDFIAIYSEAHPNELPVFDDFFRYLGEDVLPRIVPEYDDKGNIIKMPDNPYIVAYNPVTLEQFDIVKYLRALEPYSLKGSYAFLLNEKKPRDLFRSRFTVFEVDKLSQVDDQKFYSLCILCIMNAFDEKMRKSNAFKIMVIEEAWKAIANETMAPYLKGLWKTSRKFQTCAMVVTQQISDITSSDVIQDAILKNSDIKILLDQSGDMNNFGQLQRMLSLSDREKNSVLSINKSNNPKYHYREVFIKMNDWSMVGAIEASEHEAIAYESNKVKKRPVYILAKKVQSLCVAIAETVKMNRRKNEAS